MFAAAKEGARRFRAEFLGRKARSKKTGEEGVICGGWIDSSTERPGIRGSFELKTANGVEYNLSPDELELMIEPAPKQVEPPIDTPPQSMLG